MPQLDNPKAGWSLIDEDDYPNEFEGAEEIDLAALDWMDGSNGLVAGERTRITYSPMRLLQPA